MVRRVLFTLLTLLFAAVSAGPRPLAATPIRAAAAQAAAWDINQDGKVDYKDLAILGAHYGETAAPPYPAWDINQDGKIDYKDLAMLGAHYGESVDGPRFVQDGDTQWEGDYIYGDGGLSAVVIYFFVRNDGGPGAIDIPVTAASCTDESEFTALAQFTVTGSTRYVLRSEIPVAYSFRSLSPNPQCMISISASLPGEPVLTKTADLTPLLKHDSVTGLYYHNYYVPTGPPVTTLELHE